MVKSQDDFYNTCDVISGASDVMVDPIWEVYERVSGRGCPGNNFIKKFPSLLTTRPNKPECLYLVISFQSSLTFAGNTRSSPKNEASERHSNWFGSGLALKF